jgi:hypothetical protein
MHGILDRYPNPPPLPPLGFPGTFLRATRPCSGPFHHDR